MNPFVPWLPNVICDLAVPKCNKSGTRLVMYFRTMTSCCYKKKLATDFFHFLLLVTSGEKLLFYLPLAQSFCNFVTFEHFFTGFWISRRFFSFPKQNKFCRFGPFRTSAKLAIAPENVLIVGKKAPANIKI